MKPENFSNQSNTQNTNKEKTLESKLNPDFSHRINGGGFVSSASLVDATFAPIDQAYSLLTYLEGQFTGELEKFDDDVNFQMIEVACSNLKDIKAIIDAYHQAQKKERKQEFKQNNGV